MRIFIISIKGCGTNNDDKYQGMILQKYFLQYHPFNRRQLKVICIPPEFFFSFRSRLQDPDGASFHQMVAQSSTGKLPRTCSAVHSRLERATMLTSAQQSGTSSPSLASCCEKRQQTLVDPQKCQTVSSVSLPVICKPNSDSGIGGFGPLGPS